MTISLISTYRSSLMGIATIMVLLFHFQANFGIAPINAFSSIGYGGVDIFLFLSGFGLYVGYKGDARQFYIRRLARLYPTYLICAFLTFWQKGDFNPLRPIIASTGIGYYLPGFDIPSIEWYIPTMYLLCLLFPWFMSKAKMELGGAKNILLPITIGLLLTLVLIIIQKGTVILSTSRIPIFFIGVYFGHLYKKKVLLSKHVTFSLICISIITLIFEMYIVSVLDNIVLWRYAIYFLPFSIIAPGLCIALAFCLAHCNKLCFLFGIIGNISLEVYLMHVLLLNYWRKYAFEWTLSNTTLSFLSFLLLVVICSYTLSLITNPISRYIRYLENEK